MAVEVIASPWTTDKEAKTHVYPTGVQIDTDNGVLVVTDAGGKIVALASEWSVAHIVPDRGPSEG